MALWPQILGYSSLTLPSFAALTDAARHETPIVVHIIRRDLLKRLSALTLIVTLMWYSNARAEAVYLGLGILATEVAARFLSHFLPARAEDVPIWLIFAVWKVNAASTALYLAPAVVLAGSGSVPLLLVGYMWLFGVFVHISNTFVTLPLYNWHQMTPAFLMMVWLIIATSQVGYAAASQWEWLLLTALAVVYASNTVETLSQQGDTQRALSTARREASTRLRALEAMARQDALTGLLNRQTFDSRLAELLTMRRPDQDVAVLIIDLDGFKPVNDTYSHAAGDAVLMECGRRLQACTPANAIAARIGGDEFAVALAGIVDPYEALSLAEEIHEALCRPIAHDGRQLRIGASIGIGLTSQPGQTISDICGDADQAMYRAKAGTEGKAVLFDPLNFPARLSPQDRILLMKALRNGEMRAHYQPVVALSSGAIVGFEALARWHHPRRGLLAPVAFLDQIEELGLQGDFLLCMARRVFADVEAMVAAGIDPGRVSLNLPEMALATQSGRRDLEALLARHPRILRHIAFEITEDVFFARAGELIRDAIQAFRRNGIRISLDDFGTGFASFQHLRELEFDELKIDSSFIADLGEDRTAEVLVAGFLTIASGLEVDVIAEGVETEEQRAHLLAMGCTYGQGFLFEKALPFDSTLALLVNEHAEARAARA